MTNHCRGYWFRLEWWKLVFFRFTRENRVWATTSCNGYRKQWLLRCWRMQWLPEERVMCDPFIEHEVLIGDGLSKWVKAWWSLIGGVTVNSEGSLSAKKQMLRWLANPFEMNKWTTWREINCIPLMGRVDCCLFVAFIIYGASLEIVLYSVLLLFAERIKQ